jgi:hypothetical protein
MKFSESFTEIAVALVKFREIVEAPKKNKVNPHLKSKYADLQAVIDAITPALAKCKMTFLQDTVTNEKGETGAWTMFLHESGQYVEFNPVFIPNSNKNAHQEGSALSYAKRYSLSMAAGVASEDDDDAAAIVPDKQPQQTTQRKQYQQKQPTQPKTEKPVARMTKETLAKIKNVWDLTSLSLEQLDKQTEKYFKLPLNQLTEEQGQKLLEIFESKKSETKEQKKNRFAALFAAGKSQQLSNDQVKEKVYEKYSIDSLTELDDVKLADATKWIKNYGKKDTKKVS